MKLRLLHLGYTETANKVLERASKAFPRAVSITIPNMADLDDEGAVHLAGCSRLRFLDIANIACITDAGLTFLLKGFAGLDTLRISDCYAVTDDVIAALAEGCSQLTSIAIQKCHPVTDAGIMHLARCTKLARIQVAKCSNVRAVNVTTLLAGCTGLTDLRLEGCRIVMSKNSYPATGARLSHLEVTGCDLETPVIANFTKMCTQLTSLDVSCCKAGFSDDTLVALAASCPQLTVLKMADCHEVTDTGIAHLATKFSRLEVLDVSDCYQLTDAGLADLARGCARLAVLDVSLCCELTDAGLAALTEGCTFLEKLVVRSCDGVVNSRLDLLEERYPALEIHREPDNVRASGNSYFFGFLTSNRHAGSVSHY